MPFGLTNAPATFQECMNRIFFKQLKRFVLVIFDDILIYSKNWEEHLQHLEIVLKTLQEQSLFAKMSKCEFEMKELLYVGHIIGQEGGKVHMEKIRDILEWPSPKNITELRGFIGICTYYKKFVKGVSLFRALYGYDMLPPFTHLGYVAEIFKPLGVFLGASLESKLSPCS